MSPKDIRRIASATEDASSFGRYSNWHDCAKGLAQMGHGPRAISAILRSGVPSWAADEDGGPDGTVSSRSLVKYCYEHGYTSGSALVQDLIEPVIDRELSPLLKK